MGPQHKTFVSIIAIIVFVLSMGLFTVIDTEFFPQADESTVYATIELQTGTRVDNTIRTADILDSLFKAKYPEVKIISTTSGYDDQGGWESMFNAGGTHTISIP